MASSSSRRTQIQPSEAAYLRRRDICRRIPTRSVGFMTVLLAAAAPYRFFVDTPLSHSFSALDVVLLVIGAGLVVRLALGGLHAGPLAILWCLVLPLVVSVLSLAWTQDIGTTLRSALVYVEGLTIYVFTVDRLSSCNSLTVVRWMAMFVTFLLVPSFFLLFRVPGFEPQGQDLAPGSGDFLSFYARLSNPFIGRSNNLASVLVFFVFVFLIWGLRHRQRIGMALAIVSFISVVLTLSRGILLAALLTSALGVWRYRGTPIAYAIRTTLTPRALVSILMLGAISVTLFFVLNPEARALSGTRLSVGNAVDRGTRSAVAIDKIVEHPWFGYGAGVVPDDIPSLSEGVHNTYLQQLVSFGIPLGLFIIFVLLEMVRQSFRLERKHATGGGLGLFSLLLTFVTESSYEGTVLRVLVYLCIAFLVALAAAEHDCQTDESVGMEGSRSHGARWTDGI